MKTQTKQIPVFREIYRHKYYYHLENLTTPLSGQLLLPPLLSFGFFGYSKTDKKHENKNKPGQNSLSAKPKYIEFKNTINI